MSKIAIGIDIGSDGAFTTMVDGKIDHFDRLGDSVDGLMDLILQDTGTIEDIHVVIEDLHSVHGSSAKSNFGFGYNNGLIVGMLEALSIPYTKVAPKKWQKEMWEGVRPVEINTGKLNKKGEPKYKIDTKATSLIAAKRLFPGQTFLASERSKKPHNGIVDSVLLAEYCRRHFI